MRWIQSGEPVFSVTGGARIGWVNATWPLARLVVSSALLRLSAIQGTYDFLPSQVVSLERYGRIPLFSSGIRIVHARLDYPHKIIFWYLGNSERLIEKIHQAGFLPTAPAAAEVKWRGIPVRWTAILVFILVWNGLFLPMRAFAKPPLALAFIPLITTFVVCWGIRRYSWLQEAILRTGRSIGEIKAYLSLLQTVTGMLSVIFLVVVLAQVFS